MATREAALRVTIKNAGFLAGMRQMTTVAATTGTRMGAALSGPMKAGFTGAVGAMKSMMGGLVGNMKTVATLGGAFAVGKFVNDALKMQTAYRNIAFHASKTTDSVKSWQDIQAMIEPMADKTGQNVADMAEAMESVRSSTGDLDYARDVLEAIGTAATLSGERVQDYAELMQIGYRKFGIQGEEAGETIAMLEQLLGRGGASVADVNGKFGMMATEAAAAGLTGKEGMAKLLAAMVAVDNEVGEKAPMAFKTLFQALKDNTSQSEALQKKGGFKFTTDMDALDKIRETLMTAKGRKAAELTFTAEARTLYDSLVKPFDAAVAKAKEAGRTPKEATQEGLKAFDEAMGKMGTTGARTFEDLQKMAQKRMEDDPTVVMRKALNKMAVAFQDPKMMSSIEKLAKILPGVADGFVKLLDWVLKNPMLAAGGYVGARLTLGFAQGALMSAGTKIGASASAWLNKVAPTAGAKMGLAAKAALVAAAAMIGFYIGKKIADAFWDEREALEKGAQEADIAAFNAMQGKSVEDQKAALEKVRSQIAAIQESQSGMLGGLKQFYHDASAAGAAAVGADVGYVDTQADALAKLQRAQADLQSSIQKQEQAQNKGATAADRAGNSMDRLARSAEKLDKALQGVGDAPGNAPGGKGPPGRLHTGPGYAQ